MKTEIPIALPEPSRRYSQDEEWCLVRIDGQWRELRFHDYSEIFKVEGLYERLFYDVLQCASPTTVCALLAEQLAEAGVRPPELTVLDLGAGNGIVGAELARLGVARAVGVDIITEAARAAERDRPEVYAGYHVVDLTCLPEAERARLSAYRFNCMTCVAALGFGDIPPQAFLEAYNLLEDGSWLALTLKEEFLTDSDPSGFAGLISRCLDAGVIEMRCRRRYRHRLSTAGDPLYYVAVVATKREQMDEDLLR